MPTPSDLANLARCAHRDSYPTCRDCLAEVRREGRQLNTEERRGGA